jgi:uncharacterized protein YcnI
MTRTRRTLLVLALAVAAAALAAPAAAHVQVRPAQAAPADAVLWTLLVPSEQESGTLQVELAVPKDVLPFSYEDAPGWARRLRMNADGSVRSIVWRGRTRADGLATFRFLASTPQRTGTIAWKAIQTYRDGVRVRWIGSPASERPASITSVSKTAARENAGGEGGAGAANVPATVAPAAEAGDAGADWVARGFALAALLVAAAAAMTLRRRSPR